MGTTFQRAFEIENALSLSLPERVLASISMTTTRLMRSTTTWRRSENTSPVKKLFLLAFGVAYTLVVCLGWFTNTDANGLMRERRRRIIGEDEGFFFVSAEPGGA